MHRVCSAWIVKTNIEARSCSRESAYYLHNVRLSVCPPISARMPLGRLPWSLILGMFMQIDRETSDLAKIGHFTRRPKYVSLFAVIKIRREADLCNTQYLTMTCNSTVHLEGTVPFPFQECMWTCHNSTLYVHCLSCLYHTWNTRIKYGNNILFEIWIKKRSYSGRQTLSKVVQLIL